MPITHRPKIPKNAIMTIVNPIKKTVRRFTGSFLIVSSTFLNSEEISSPAFLIGLKLSGDAFPDSGFVSVFGVGFMRKRKLFISV